MFFADPRVSLMIDERKAGDPLQGARIMLMGTAAVTSDRDARRRYLERQPEAQMFAGFADFAFYRVTLKRREAEFCLPRPKVPSRLPDTTSSLSAR